MKNEFWEKKMSRTTDAELLQEIEALETWLQGNLHEDVRADMELSLEVYREELANRSRQLKLF